MRERGLEPPRVLPHKILSLARLPVPPLPHSSFDFTSFCHFRKIRPQPITHILQQAPAILSGESCIAKLVNFTDTDSMVRLSSGRSQFRAFVECTGQPATHEVDSNRYLNPSFTKQTCSAKHHSSFHLCDYCLAFWSRCQERHSVSAWQTAVFLRNLRDRKRRWRKLHATRAA